MAALKIKVYLKHDRKIYSEHAESKLVLKLNQDGNGEYLLNGF
jgi:hypothetical protein